MKREKIFNLIGIIIGIAIIIVGCTVMFDKHVTAPNLNNDNVNISVSDTTSDASFGADFYTYEYDATQAAANNTAISADNSTVIAENSTTIANRMSNFTANIIDKISYCAGIAFKITGILVLLSYAKKFSLCFVKNNNAETSDKSSESIIEDNNNLLEQKNGDKN